MERKRNVRSTAIFALTVGLLILGLWMASDVSAQSDGPCAEDAAKFCKGVKPGRGIAQCLNEHESELSAACKDKIAAAKKKMIKLSQVCKDDVEKFCKDVQPGDGRLVKCLKEHEGELAPECKARVSRPGTKPRQ